MVMVDGFRRVIPAAPLKPVSTRWVTVYELWSFRRVIPAAPLKRIKWHCNVPPQPRRFRRVIPAAPLKLGCEVEPHRLGRVSAG